MAKKEVEKVVKKDVRKRYDSKGRVLNKGEQERDGKYMYCYQDENGKTKYCLLCL